MPPAGRDAGARARPGGARGPRPAGDRARRPRRGPGRRRVGRSPAAAARAAVERAITIRPVGVDVAVGASTVTVTVSAVNHTDVAIVGRRDRRCRAARQRHDGARATLTARRCQLPFGRGSAGARRPGRRHADDRPRRPRRPRLGAAPAGRAHTGRPRPSRRDDRRRSRRRRRRSTTRPSACSSPPPGGRVSWAASSRSCARPTACSPGSRSPASTGRSRSAAGLNGLGASRTRRRLRSREGRARGRSRAAGPRSCPRRSRGSWRRGTCARRACRR